MRYLKQYDKYSCGPIAVMNVVKWAGVRTTYKNHFKKFCKRCNCSFKGSYMTGLRRSLKQYKRLKVKYRNDPRLWEVYLHMKSGGIVLFDVSHDSEKYDFEGHFFLCIGMLKKKYVLVNYQEGCTYSIVSEDHLISEILIVEETRCLFISNRNAK